jgi:hypothetical protein
MHIAEAPGLDGAGGVTVPSVVVEVWAHENYIAFVDPASNLSSEIIKESLAWVSCFSLVYKVFFLL